MEYTDNTAVLELRKVTPKNVIVHEDIQDAEVYYPSKMNENLEVEPISVQPLSVTPNFIDNGNTSYDKPFIEANTIEVELSHLKHDCIIPVFSKDNEKTIAHQECMSSN